MTGLVVTVFFFRRDIPFFASGFLSIFGECVCWGAGGGGVL